MTILKRIVSFKLRSCCFIPLLILISVYSTACQTGTTPPAIASTQSSTAVGRAVTPETSKMSAPKQNTANSTPSLTPEAKEFSWQAVLSFFGKEPTVTKSSFPVGEDYVEYNAQSGDFLTAVASRFGVMSEKIKSPSHIPKHGLIPAGQLLLIPFQSNRQGPTTLFIEAKPLIPDTEIVYGPSAANFDVEEYLQRTGGYLATHQEYLKSTGWTKAGDIITRIALENSINPRLLLALLEYECHCVLGTSSGNLKSGYVLGIEDFHTKGLYGQLGWAINELSKGYYSWRSGNLHEVSLPNGETIRFAPQLNPGTVSLIYYYAIQSSQKALQEIPVGQQAYAGKIDLDKDFMQFFDEQEGFISLYETMFGNPWMREETFGPIFPNGIAQPTLQLPFEPGISWSYTSGPHQAWQTDGALAALDFAPATAYEGCVPSKVWVTAVGDGPIVRVGNGIVIQDLDGFNAAGQPDQSDWTEQTGWAILYMHIDSIDKVAEGAHLKAGDHIGHPSCAGGPATGTHLHIARKFNGEWVLADGPLPFVMSGWIPHAGEKPYEGTLTKGDHTVIAHPYGSYETLISIPKETPTPEGTITPDEIEY